MKVITEAIIRAELKATQPEVYVIPEGKILSPAAREYLQSIQVDIVSEKDKDKKPAKAKNNKSEAKDEVSEKVQKSDVCVEPEQEKFKYLDYETGAGYTAKPEHMTQLYGNMLVDKNHPRIRYRGKLDSLQAQIVHAQCIIEKEEGNDLIVNELGNILDILREMMRCEILEEKFTNETIIGLTHKELRERSHNPMKFYNIKQMLLPDRSMGLTYSLLNMIRTSIREMEVLAVDAFKVNRRLDRVDIIQEINRLSSALHIMMCRYLAGDYSK